MFPRRGQSLPRLSSRGLRSACQFESNRGRNNDPATAGSFFRPIVPPKCDAAAVSFGGPVRSASIGQDRGFPDISDISVIVWISHRLLCRVGSGRALLAELTRPGGLTFVLDYPINVENANELRV
jgi:hypothetical protein